MKCFTANLFSSNTAEVPTPLVLSYGMGVDSTAILVLWARQGIVPDAIIFADTGSENPRTYAYKAVIDRFLSSVGFPAITVVRYAPQHGHYNSLLSDCLIKGMLPSLAYGSKGCSQKMKVQPITAYLKTWPQAIRAWSNGQKIRHAIGYDAGPKDMRRGKEAFDSDLETFVYPLREVGWDRERCITEIAADKTLASIAAEVGLSAVPPKSACVMCPSTKADEIDEMASLMPEILGLALLIEAEAAPRSTSVAGLWRKATKSLPGSWGEYAASQGFAGLDQAAIADQVFARSGSLGPAGAPPAGSRFAVRRNENFEYYSDL